MIHRSASLSGITSSFNYRPTLERSASVTSENIFSSQAFRATNCKPALERTKKIENIYKESISDYLNFDSEITFRTIKSTKEVDARNYIYLGSVTAMPVNQSGITLDERGNLCLIKGNSYNLLKGFIKKTLCREKYESASLLAAEQDADIKFQSLYLNEQGLLIGKEKFSEKLYTVEIKRKEKDISGDLSPDLVSVCCKAYNGENPESLCFRVKEGESMSFSLKNGSLYLDELTLCGKKYDYSLQHYQIKLPLTKGTAISSVKKTGNLIQIELLKKKRKKIVYLNPAEISTSQLSASHLSHKPPQSLSARLGADPHEKSFSGQPFSAMRFGNFNSRYIPLFSWYTDNFRVNLKKAKQAHFANHKMQAVRRLVDSIDPGIRASFSTIKSLIGSASLAAKHPINSEQAIVNKNREAAATHQGRVNNLLSEAGYRQEKNEIATQLLALLGETKPGDELQLSLDDNVSFFVGAALGGLPVVKGCFAGAVFPFMTTHRISLNHTSDGKIKFNFENKSSKGAISLAGTGQGLEDVCKVVAHNGTDYMTVMPAEANLILIMNAAKGDSFSFEIDKKHLPEFLEDFCNANKTAESMPNIITNPEVIKTNDKELILRLETKAELRLQNGQMVNGTTYMVFPRTAVGICLALNFIQLNKYHREKIEKDRSVHASDLKISLVNVDFSIFKEVKIMPIAMKQVNSELLCFPLPLLEEVNNLYQYSSPYGFSKAWHTDKITANGAAEAKQAADTGCASGSYFYPASDSACVTGSASASPAPDFSTEARDNLKTVADTGDTRNAAKTFDTFSAVPEIRLADPLETYIYEALQDKVSTVISSSKLADIPLIISHKGKTKQTFKEAAAACPVLSETRKRLKKIRQFCLQQERQNLNKCVVTFAELTYELSGEDQMKRDVLLAKAAGLSSATDEQKEKIKEELAALKKSASYQIKEVEPCRRSQLSDKARLPLAILNFTHESSLAYQQRLGKISFEYSAGSLIPARVSDNIQCLF